MGDSHLAHYGVKGMKWGKRKAEASAEPANPSYTKRMRDNDRRYLGRKAEQNVNRAMNAGKTRQQALREENVRVNKARSQRGIAIATAYFALKSPYVRGAFKEGGRVAAHLIAQRAETNRGARAAQDVFTREANFRKGAYNVSSF